MLIGRRSFPLEVATLSGGEPVKLPGLYLLSLRKLPLFFHENEGTEPEPKVMKVFGADNFPFQTDEPRKKNSYFPLYWLVNRDPYNGLL